MWKDLGDSAVGEQTTELYYSDYSGTSETGVLVPLMHSSQKYRQQYYSDDVGNCWSLLFADSSLLPEVHNRVKEQSNTVGLLDSVGLW